MSIPTAKAIASVVICAAGAYSMFITGGETGIGWALAGMFFLWVE